MRIGLCLLLSVILATGCSPFGRDEEPVYVASVSDPVVCLVTLKRPRTWCGATSESSVDEHFKLVEGKPLSWFDPNTCASATKQQSGAIDVNERRDCPSQMDLSRDFRQPTLYDVVFRIPGDDTETELARLFGMMVLEGQPFELVVPDAGRSAIGANFGTDRSVAERIVQDIAALPSPIEIERNAPL